jgi:hypothetical protein
MPDTILTEKGCIRLTNEDVMETLCCVRVVSEPATAAAPGSHRPRVRSTQAAAPGLRCRDILYANVPRCYGYTGPVSVAKMTRFRIFLLLIPLLILAASSATQRELIAAADRRDDAALIKALATRAKRGDTCSAVVRGRSRYTLPHGPRGVYL